MGRKGHINFLGLSVQQKFRFEISNIMHGQWGNGTFQLLRPDSGRDAFRAFDLCQIKRQQKLNKKKALKKWQTHSSNHYKLIDLDCSSWMHKKHKCAVLYSQMDARFVQILTNVCHVEHQFRHSQHIHRTGIRTGSKRNCSLISVNLIYVQN